jgi:hypothetical protein
MTTEQITEALNTIQGLVNAIQEACEDYGGWAGDDASAVRALAIGNQLEGLGFAVGLYGREYAESSGL